jgi:hypothetical protein
LLGITFEQNLYDFSSGKFLKNPKKEKNRKILKDLDLKTLDL